MSGLLTEIFALETQGAVERLLYKQQSSSLYLHRSLRLFISTHIFLVIKELLHCSYHPIFSLILEKLER